MSKNSFVWCKNQACRFPVAMIWYFYFSMLSYSEKVAESHEFQSGILAERYSCHQNSLSDGVWQLKMKVFLSNLFCLSYNLLFLQRSSCEWVHWEVFKYIAYNYLSLESRIKNYNQGFYASKVIINLAIFDIHKVRYGSDFWTRDWSGQ